MQINKHSEKRIAQMVADAYKFVDNATPTCSQAVRQTKRIDGRANNSGYGYRRPIVVIEGKKRFEFPSINSCAHSEKFRCNPKTIRRFAESGEIFGNRRVFYKDREPEGNK